MKRVGIFCVLGFVLLTSVSSCDNNIRKSEVISDTDYNVIKINKDEMSFGVSTEKPSDADFYINSNFFNCYSWKWKRFSCNL